MIRIVERPFLSTYSGVETGKYIMKEDHAHGRRFHGDASGLRSQKRLSLLEVDRVVDLCVESREVKSVLDVGTGTGVFAEAFSKKGLHVTGVDANESLLADARVYMPAARFVKGSAEALPFSDGSFDLVFLGHVLHEADDPVTALKEAGRVAKVIIAVLEWPYTEEEYGPPLSERLRPEAIIDFAKQAGYSGTERMALTHMDLYLMLP
jgi:SAM-dependent methyltransferase